MALKRKAQTQPEDEQPILKSKQKDEYETKFTITDTHPEWTKIIEEKQVTVVGKLTLQECADWLDLPVLKKVAQFWPRFKEDRKRPLTIAEVTENCVYGNLYLVDEDKKNFDAQSQTLVFMDTMAKMIKLCADECRDDLDEKESVTEASCCQLLGLEEWKVLEDFYYWVYRASYFPTSEKVKAALFDKEEGFRGFYGPGKNDQDFCSALEKVSESIRLMIQGVK